MITACETEVSLFTLANGFTVLRIIALPFIVVLVLRSADGSSGAATVIFMIAAWTDFFDGFIARRTGTVTDIGRMLDPLADRLFISGTIIALAIAGVLPWQGVIIVTARDILMLFGYKLLLARGGAPQVSLLGKSYTALFMLAIAVCMVGFEPGGLRVGWWLFWAGVTGSIVTGIAYALQGLKLVRQAEGKA
ncbi:MAG: CDP-alcohol phosphatidyltransferase family protein [Thermoleophilia bacterium]